MVFGFSFEIFEIVSHVVVRDNVRLPVHFAQFPSRNSLQNYVRTTGLLTLAQSTSLIQSSLLRLVLICVVGWVGAAVYTFRENFSRNILET